MPRKSLHERIKEAELGKTGQPEVDVPGGRVDGVLRRKAFQVAVNPTLAELRDDVRVLKKAPQKQKVVIVNKEKYVPQAEQVMKEEGLSGTARTPRRPGQPPLRSVHVRKAKR